MRDFQYYEMRLAEEIETNKQLVKFIERYKKALKLALYYIEGDATWEGVNAQIDKILKGEENEQSNEIR